MTQWFRGNIEGYYVGKPARPGTLGVNDGRGFQLVVYRAAIRDVELLDFVPPTPATEAAAATSERTTEAAADTSEAAAASSEAEQPPLVFPPWLPAPGTAFFQPTITDARLFPVRHAMGWFEGPVHQVFIEQFRSTHSKQHGQQLYGRFVGRAHGYFALPPAPRPEAAERLVQAFQDLPDDATAPDTSHSEARANARELRRDHFQVSAASEATLVPASSTAEAAPAETQGTPTGQLGATTPLGVAQSNTALHSASFEPQHPAREPNATPPDAPAPPPGPPRPRGGRVPFLILVTLVAAALLLTCGAPRALLWLLFLLPTLLLRRVVVGLAPDSTALRGFSALVTLGQAWLAGMVFVGWWETGCRDVHPVPLIGTLTGLVIASLLPSDVPLLVNASTLAAMLIGWCTGKDACGADTHTQRDVSHESPILPENDHP